jgi:hypothetical protein
MMRDKYPPLYLITGIVIGILIGCLIAFVLLPVHFKDTSPATLSQEQAEVYRSLVGRAYLYEADSGRAFSRLALLNEPDLQSIIAAQSQKMAAGTGDEQSARGLSLLAGVFANPSQMITPLVQTLETAAQTPTSSVLPPTATMSLEATTTPAAPTKTPFATFTPRPSATPKPTQGAPYTLIGDPKEDCDVGSVVSQLMVYVYDADGNGVPGVKIEISVPNGGSMNFFTGLYPEINNGYADFTMAPDTTYSLRVGIGGDIINGLSLPQCSASDGTTYSGNLVLTFKQE